MKFSQFNTFFNHEDRKVGYNAYSNEFIILDPELYEILLAVKRESALDELKEIHSEFYYHLIEKGFLVDINENEIENVKQLAQKVDKEDDSFFHLTINPTMNCNFKCWYCYETHIKDSKMSLFTVNSITKLIDNLIEEKKELKRIHISWFGGEPLLYFNKTVKPIFENLAPKLSKNNISFTSGFTTNGLLINQQMLDCCKKYGANFFQITLDGHRERHNEVRFISKEKGSYDEIINNIYLCIKNNLNVSVRLNISEETIEKLDLIIQDFNHLSEDEKKYLNFSFHEVWQEKKDIQSNVQELVNRFRDEGFNSIYKGVNLDTVRNSCYADKKNHATINYNGEIYKCTARDFKSENKEGDLNENGEIIWNDKYHKRMNSKFKNVPCLKCKILPICNGGCSQQAVENEGREYCIHNFDEIKKEEIVKDKFLYAIS